MLPWPSLSPLTLVAARRPGAAAALHPEFPPAFSLAVPAPTLIKPQQSARCRQPQARDPCVSKPSPPTPPGLCTSKAIRRAMALHGSGQLKDETAGAP
jgi:hypothetical protein